MLMTVGKYFVHVVLHACLKKVGYFPMHAVLQCVHLSFNFNLISRSVGTTKLYKKRCPSEPNHLYNAPQPHNLECHMYLYMAKTMKQFICHTLPKHHHDGNFIAFCAIGSCMYSTYQLLPTKFI